ncbi:MAG: ABC transporter substrate-binding protein [Burkholderiales bacterium]|jgi:ABC-type nitrate/sulfonate/bicarbonate transport system substrate-binding protein|nr:ABC transporter substrate-binding protein [Burkholderiales bacterium]
MPTLRLLWFVPTPIAVVAQAASLHEGIELRAQRNPSSDAQFEALRDGEVDAVVTAMDNVMDWNLRPGPQDLRIAAQLERTTPLTLVGRRGLASLGELPQARILVDAPRNGFVVALLALAADAGLSVADLQLLPAGGVSERFDALRAGRGDATLLGPPFDAMALDAGMQSIASIQQRYPDFPGQGLVVSASAMDRLRPALRHWLTGLELARQLMSSDPGLCLDALLRAGFPPHAVAGLIAAAPRSLVPDRAGIELLVRQRQQVGLPGAQLGVDDLVDLNALPPR